MVQRLPAGALQLLILQPTPFCNIDCDYCYLPDRASTARMGMDVLGAALDRVFESGLAGERFTVVWHAGEPLVLGVPYYREALGVIAARTPPGVTVSHSFQTNAMLLDEAWCDFIEATGIQVGVSLDGPAPLHDSRRRTRSGRGTLAQALAGVGRLRERGIGFHCITVLTHAALGFPDELFEFYMDNGIRRVGLNVEEIEGRHGSSSLAGLDVDRRYRAFMRRFLALVQRYGNELEVRELSEVQQVAGAPSGDLRDQQSAAWSIVSVAVDGGFTTFSPELLGMQRAPYGDFILGNVRTHSLEDGARSPRFLQMDEDIAAGIAACRAECLYFEVCGGGAPANKLFENGSFRSTETLFCRLTKKALFDVCGEFLAAPPRGAAVGP